MMNSFFKLFGYVLIVFSFVDLIYPDVLIRWNLFSKNLLGSLAVFTPVIFYLSGSILVKFTSDDNDNIEQYKKSQDK